jgi:hypothetical protein
MKYDKRSIAPSRLLKKKPILAGELPGRQGWVLACSDSGGWTGRTRSYGTDELWQADEIVGCGRHGE